MVSQVKRKFKTAEIVFIVLACIILLFGILDFAGVVHLKGQFLISELAFVSLANILYWKPRRGIVFVRLLQVLTAALAAAGTLFLFWDAGKTLNAACLFIVGVIMMVSSFIKGNDNSGKNKPKGEEKSPAPN